VVKMLKKKKKLTNTAALRSATGEVRGHPAVFPEKLAEMHIQSWSNPGDIILDPFIGSGTTAKMAALNGRKYIGIDISDEYCEIARRRVSDSIIEARTGTKADTSEGQAKQ